MTKEQKLTKISVPTKSNKLLTQVLEKVNTNEELFALWEAINVNALKRLEMTDHGIVHFQIVSNIALRLMRLLHEERIEMSITTDHNLDYDYAEVVVFLASLTHDLGMTINRNGHEEFSLIIADRILHNLLEFMPVRERTIVISETLHSIISHRKGGTPYTIEAGILRVSDALDMSHGRSKTPIAAGHFDIHSLSHAAIDTVEIMKGEERPIQINISMNNSSGLFQIDELLKSKLKGSGIEKYIEVKSDIKRESEKSLLKEIVVKL